ncbi:hypothetical protein [Mesobacillus subterraneus]|uniref:Uncharacterized protein n=1 Tax=Mesobacillus subterraneus TaxID=285983 RepID=A0A3R9FZ25_9BACI|nr:hypothetical protein [Mesobacillus subterraneus]RSD28436.1 hypothetical protein EJA10_04950 [Mesobacillus subterraneus]
MAERSLIYFNSKGEIIEIPIQMQQENRGILIEFCAEAIVPEGFTFQHDGFANFSFCTDVSELGCMAENVEGEATFPNLCGRELTCPVSVNAVRAVGCIRCHVNLGRLIPNVAGFNFGSDHTLCFNKIVCVNQIIGYTCSQATCGENCFQFEDGFVSINPADQITSACGRQIVVIRGGLRIVLRDS